MKAKLVITTDSGITHYVENPNLGVSAVIGSDEYNLFNARAIANVIELDGFKLGAGDTITIVEVE